MKILSIDTSTQNCSLAVMDGDRVICFRNEKLGNKLSEKLVSRIDHILEKAGCPLADLGGIAVGLGPGSFTSLRVGLATAKGLCFASDMPLVGISSLDALALGVRQPDARICVIADAKRKMVYCCQYEKKEGLLSRTGDYALLTKDDLLKKKLDGYVFAGDGISLMNNEITHQFKDITVEDNKRWFPQARMLGALAGTKFEQKKHDDIDRILPMYLHPQDCMVRK